MILFVVVARGIAFLVVWWWYWPVLKDFGKTFTDLYVCAFGWGFVSLPVVQYGRASLWAERAVAHVCRCWSVILFVWWWY